MKRRILLAALLALGALGQGAARADLVDAVVATVGREVILYSELMLEAAPYIESLRVGAVSEAEFERELEEILEEALEQAIEQRILYREAQLAGVRIEDADIEQRLDRIRREYDSEEAFRRVLEGAGESMTDFRERLRKQLMAIAVGMQRRRAFEREAVVTESDIRQYYEDNRAEFEHPERLRVRRIFLAANPDPEARARARARLEALREEVDLGADFGALAEAHSEGPEADMGGIIGWVGRDDLVPELEEAVFALDTGELSAPVETEFGVHLLLVEDRREAGVADYDEARAEIEPILRGQYADQRYRRWMDELRRRSQVQVFF